MHHGSDDDLAPTNEVWRCSDVVFAFPSGHKKTDVPYVAQRIENRGESETIAVAGGPRESVPDHEDSKPTILANPLGV
jgi:hypothetical protein